MTDLNNKPSIDPADEGNMPGLFRHVFSKMMQHVDGMLPAKVVAYNNDRNNPRVTVQPLIAIVTTGASKISRAQIASVPVFQFGAGGYIMSFPITAGSLGWILANDRDISIFLQGYTESQPQTYRKKNFADAVFIPDVMTGYNINAEDNNNAVLQANSGNVRVALWPEFVKVTAPQGLGVNTQPAEDVIFDVESTTKATRPWPRMTLGQRDAIPNPQEGMVVWIIGSGLSTYNGATWS